jgi:GDPmannose 4,6-dehydratase
LFNHESPRRGETFVTRKIAQAAARIKMGLQSRLYLGNMEARRDWGYAPEYVNAMWLMLQQERPEDFVIGTGESHSVKDFLDLAFACVDLDWHNHVEIDPLYYRPSEVDDLVAETTKARKQLQWHHRVDFRELVSVMVQAELEAISNGKHSMSNENPGYPPNRLRVEAP